MIEINLLPVREARRRESIRFQVSVFFLSIILVFSIIALLQWQLHREKAEIERETKSVKARIAELDKVVGEISKIKKEKKKLEMRLKVIDKLERGRLSAAKLLDELSLKVPKQVWIDRLSKGGRELRLEGVALDEETIANFMATLQSSRYIRSVELEITEQFQTGGVKLKKFKLRCSTTL